MNRKLKDRIAELVREDVSLVPYNPDWPALFTREAEFLRSKLPSSILRRIEHFGSTAVPSLSSKPIIDLLIEVTSLSETKRQIAPILESLGYEYFWRLDCNPPYAWFIKRNEHRVRTHHLHFVEKDSVLWERLLFRDFLREFPEEARRYEELKIALVEQHPTDRIRYTEEKSDFVRTVTERAKHYYAAKTSDI